MISQAMESRSPTHFAKSDFPSNCIAVDEIIDVKCSSNGNPYYSSLHCDFLDIAEVVTVADCVTSDDSLDMCGVLSITKIIPENKTHSNTHISGRDLGVTESSFRENFCEISVVNNENEVPFEQTSGREILRTVSGDPCSTVIVSSPSSLPEVGRSSSDSSTLSSFVTATEDFDEENCSWTECEVVSTSDVSERKNNTKENDLSFKVVDVMDISSSGENEVDAFSRCHRSLRGTTQSCEVNQCLCCMTTDDPKMLPSLHLESHVMDNMEADDYNRIPSCRASVFDSSTDHKFIAEQPGIPPSSVFEPCEIEAVPNKDYFSMSHEGIIDEFYTDYMLDVQPLSESCKARMKTKMKNAVSSFHTGMGNEYDAYFSNAMVAGNHLAQPSSLLGPLETEMKSREKNCHVSSRPSIFDTGHSNNIITEELLHSAGVNHYKIEDEVRKGIGKLPSDPNTMGGDVSDKFLCSVMQSSGKVEEPDIELTKHLIQGLSFFTPVRDFIKSHKLLGQHPIKYAKSLEDEQVFGFDELGCNRNSQLCPPGTASSAVNVDLLEGHCGHFKLGSTYTIHQNDSISVMSKKKCITFGSITIYYFQRAQGFAAVSSDGGVALGMELRHCDVRLHSVLDYATQKHKLQLESLHRKRKKKQVTNCSSADRKSQQSVQTLSSHKRASLLRAAGIRNFDHVAIQEAVMINASRLACGCCCVDNCLPDVCVCARLEIECLIDLEGFPCKCSAERCRNPYGHTKFSPTKVRSHFVHTLMQLEKKEVPDVASQEGDWVQEGMPGPEEPRTHVGTSPTPIMDFTHNIWM